MYAEDEESHKEEEHGENEPEEEAQDPVDDEDEPLIFTNPMEKILQEEWDKCENFV